jgi:hypothetical protein
MNITEFQNGIKQIEAALQGAFPQDFLAFIWSRFKDTDSGVWKRMVELLSRMDKQSRQVVAADFYRVSGTAKDEEHSREKPKRYDVGAGKVRPFSDIIDDFAQSKNTKLQEIAMYVKRKRKPQSPTGSNQ